MAEEIFRSGILIFPNLTQLDLVLVPGGGGINPLLEDPETLAFLRRSAAAL